MLVVTLLNVKTSIEIGDEEPIQTCGRPPPAVDLVDEPAQASSSPNGPYRESWLISFLFWYFVFLLPQGNTSRRTVCVKETDPTRTGTSSSGLPARSSVFSRAAPSRAATTSRSTSAPCSRLLSSRSGSPGPCGRAGTYEKATKFSCCSEAPAL